MDFCSIASGSSGNCIFIGSERSSLLVDAGISGKRITEGVHGIDRKLSELDGILITHEHTDHIQGLGVLARKYGIPVFATAGTLQAIKINTSLGKIEPGLLHEIREDEAFMLNDLRVQPFRISHDAAQPVGYRISCGTKHVAVATDMGCYNNYVVENLKGLDALLLEANHDVNMLQVGKYPYPLKQRILSKKGPFQ